VTKIADLLSQKIKGDAAIFTSNSLNMKVNHLISDNIPDKALYSASQLDLETASCFLAYHLIGFPPNQILNPEIEILSSLFVSQSESQ